MPMMSTGVGAQDSLVFTFVSTGVSYVGSSATTAANPNSPLWTIEGTKFAALNPGTVALTGNKKITFEITPAHQLLTFSCTGNTLTGSFPDFSRCPLITSIDVGNNALTGQMTSLSNLSALKTLGFATNTLSGPISSLSACTALTTITGRASGVSGPIPSLAACTALTTVDLALNSHTGPLPSLSTNTLLTSFNVRTNMTIGGNIPTIVNNAVLASFFAYDNVLTGVDAGFAVPAACHDFEVQNNLLTQAAVDAILAAFVLAGAAGAFILNVGGTGNATPSAAGLANKATLVGRGWTVTTN